jgi:WhiB family transcriptional regulator, redox-sensing transcriptional regulator
MYAGRAEDQVPDQYMEPRFWDIPAWMEYGLCAAGTAPDTWFPPPGSRSSHDPAIRAAKAICGECPVCIECLDYALSRGETGIWGGTTDRERRIIRKRAS